MFTKVLYAKIRKIRNRKVVPAKQRKPRSSSSRSKLKKKEKKFDFSVYQNNERGDRIFWKFLGKILTNQEHESIIRWTGNCLEFTIIDENQLAFLWGQKKNKPKMQPLHVTRVIRDHYRKNIKKPLEKISIPILKKAIAERTYQFETSFELCSLLNCTALQLKEYAQLVARWWYTEPPEASLTRHSSLETLAIKPSIIPQTYDPQPSTSAVQQAPLASPKEPEAPESFNEQSSIDQLSQTSESQQCSSSEVSTSVAQDDTEFQMSIATGIAFRDPNTSQSNSPLSPVTNLANMMNSM